MKKFTGNFTISAGKALKTSDRLICRTTDEGEIYVTNGFVAYKMIPPEYAAIVQPAVCCEAGNWSFQNGDKREEVTFDLVKTFRDSVNSVSEAAALERCPLVLTTGKDRTAAEIIAARFTGLDGVTATIKGAHTAAPVVWLSGDTDKHADEIKAAGAKWSGKRSAFYVRVA